VKPLFVPDPRTEDWLLVGSTWNAVAVLGAYVYFVKHLGPSLMKNRPAFKLDGMMKAYNLLQIAYNTYMLIGVRLASLWVP
jgi:hypothetical protein